MKNIPIHFTEQLISEVKEALPPNYEVFSVDTPKNTRVVSHICIKCKDQKFGPSYPVESLFEWYTSEFEGKSIKTFAIKFSAIAIKDIADFENTRKILPENLTYGYAKKKLFLQLVNTERNEELLKDVPHTTFKDLSVIYRVAIELPDENKENLLKSFIVTNNLYESWGAPKDIYEVSLSNTRKILPIKIFDVIESFSTLSDIPCSPDLFPRQYCLTNKFELFGAANILYDDVLKELARMCDGSFFIAPSSIEEVLIYPENLVYPEVLVSSIQDVNELLPSELFLSNNLYHYNVKTKSLEIYETQNLSQSMR